MILYIDTTDFNKVTFGVVKSHPRLDRGSKNIDSGSEAGMTHKKFYKIDPHKSHETLAKLDEFLRQSKIRNPQSTIKKIVVNKGPGSYTGVRVGVTHALALSFAWGAKVSALGAADFTRMTTLNKR